MTAENPVTGHGESRRRLLLELFRAGLGRVDGRSCVARALRGILTGGAASGGGGGASVGGAASFGDGPSAAAGEIWIAAVGKAASAMVLGAHDALGRSIQRVLLITKDGHVSAEARRLSRIEIYESAHPVPDNRSLEAGARLLRWVDELPAEAQPLFLVSGGASSLVEVLEEGVTFGDLARINSQGLAEGCRSVS